MQVRQVDDKPGIDVELDALAGAADRGLIAQRCILRLLPGIETDLFGIGALKVRGRTNEDLASAAVDDDGASGIHKVDQPFGLADGGNAQRARHDGDVAGAPALLQHHAAQLRAVIIEKLGRAHVAGDHDRVHRQVGARRRGDRPRQDAQQPVRQVVEVVHALAQIRIGCARHARAVVILHALDGRFRGEARVDRLAQAVHPALVMGEHADGFEHVGIFGGAALGVRAIEQFIDMGAELRHGILEAALFGGHVFRNEILDDDARFVQHGVAERHAFGQRITAQMVASDMGDVGGDFACHLAQFARGDDLGQHHGGCLECLLFLLGVVPPGAVLHHEHADDRTAAHDRHAEEGVVDFFARLGEVFERGVLLGVGEIEPDRLLGDGADEALARLQLGLVHGLALEALGGVELEKVARPHDVDRADLGHHVGGDDLDDLVKALLRCDRLRHDLAEPSEQDAGTQGGGCHQPPSPRTQARTALKRPAFVMVWLMHRRMG